MCDDCVLEGIEEKKGSQLIEPKENQDDKAEGEIEQEEEIQEE